MHNFTSSLFHYTKKRKNLVSILRKGLIPNYCKEEFGIDKNRIIKGIPMVSFCDIPIMRVHDFCKRYGKFSIAFTKEWALKNNINPVFYVTNNDVLSAMSLLISMENYFSNLAGTNGNSINVNLNDPSSLKKMENFIRSQQTKLANISLLGFTKLYESMHNGNMQNNYEENEWRYVVKDENIPWIDNEKNYNIWRGNTENQKPTPSKEMINKALKFNIDDITYLITQKDSDTEKLINDISKMKMFCGKSLFSDFDKRRLTNKIISFEKIDRDF